MRNTAPDLLDGALGRVLFESSLDGVVVLSHEGRQGTTLEANQAALALPFSQLERLLLDHETPDAELFAFHEQLQARGRAATEVCVPSDTGEPRQIHIEGRTVGARRVFLLRDVTTMRAQEEELRVVRRHEAIGRFATSMAHDLNNVLAPIGCMTQVLAGEVGEGTPSGTMLRDVADLAR